MTFRHLFIAVICWFFASCATTKLIKYEVVLPPRVLLPQTKKVGIVNRILPSEENKKANKIEEILSLEGYKLDQKASEASVDEMANYFVRNQFEAQVIDKAAFKTNAISQRPEPLTWQQIDSICSTNKVDFLLVLEFFDTKSTFTQTATPTVVALPGGTTVNTFKYTVNVHTTIDQFWRMYNPKTQKIIDEYTDQETVTSSSTGISLLAAYQAIQNRETQVLNAARNDVKVYANQLFERKIWNSEYYYAKGSEKLVQASRMAETKNIVAANEVWKTENTSNNKIQGRAIYNQAIAQDYLANTDEAIRLARLSYEQYNIKKGKKLANSIQSRTPKTTNNVY